MTTTAVEFDVQKARAALKSAAFFQNPKGNLEFCRFDIANAKLGIRVILSVNHHGGEVHVRTQVVPLGFVDTNQAEDMQYVISDGDFHSVEEVEYDERFGSVTFNLREGELIRGCFVRVNNKGSFNFKVA